MRVSTRLLIVALSTMVGFALLPPAVASDTMPIRVTVDGEAVAADPGTTAGQLLDRLGRAPKSADLISLRGRVLQAGAVSGRILIDGAHASRETVLQDGAVIALEAARNRKEDVTRSASPVASPAGNPVRGIPANYGVSVVTFRGRVSGETVRVVNPPGADKKAAIALTFDDGPDPVYTPQILAILARYKVKATFFWTGRNMGRYPRIVAAARAAGHSIQNHTDNHQNLGRSGFAAQESAIVGALREIRRQKVAFPKWMRPPYGSFNAWTLTIARKHGMRTILWTVDPFDYRRPAALPLARRVLAAVRPGAVVLLHDGGGPRAGTVGALPIILDALLKRGYRPVALN